jgi:large subunit ribosomal protein L15
MELYNLKPGPKKSRKRVGRGPGSGTGKTAGRGHKGQKSRSGSSRRLSFEGGQMPLSRRMPKRGFWHGDRFPMAIINLDALEKHLENGAEVNVESLTQAKLIRPRKGGLKVLGRGEITKRFNVKAHAVSDGARQKIEAAGGTVELVPAPSKA